MVGAEIRPELIVRERPETCTSARRADAIASLFQVHPRMSKFGYFPMAGSHPDKSG